MEREREGEENGRITLAREGRGPLTHSLGYLFPYSRLGLARAFSFVDTTRVPSQRVYCNSFVKVWLALVGEAARERSSFGAITQPLARIS